MPNNFYKNWSSHEIWRLQDFLSRESILGNKAYKGELDGNMNPELFEAIKEYQRQNDLSVDGLWGYNTNLLHRVVMSNTLDKGSYKPNQKTDMRWAKPGLSKVTTTVDDLTKEELEEITRFYYENPELLYSDSDSNPKWRQIFHNSGKFGSDFLNKIAAMIPKDKREKINPQKLTTQYKIDAVKDDIHNAYTKWNPFLTALITAPLTYGMNLKQFAGAAIGGMTGGLLGETGGDIIGVIQSVDPNNNKYAGSEDPVEQRYGGAYVNYDPKRTVTTARNYGKAVGGGLGALLGGVFSQYVGKPSLEGFRANAESPYLWNRKSTIATYRPRAIRSDFGGKHRHPIGPIPPTYPTILINREPFPHFENLSRVKAKGGVLIPKTNY